MTMIKGSTAKLSAILALALAMVMLCGVAMAAEVGLTDALKIAYAHAKVDEADLLEWEIELDESLVGSYFEIEFKTAEAKYEYELDVKTGEILSSSLKRQTSAQTADILEIISMDEAMEVALAHAKVQAKDVAFEKLSYAQKRGKAYYEFEFYVGITHYEYDIDAVTGEVVAYEYER